MNTFDQWFPDGDAPEIKNIIPFRADIKLPANKEQEGVVFLFNNYKKREKKVARPKTNVLELRAKENKAVIFEYGLLNKKNKDGKKV